MKKIAIIGYGAATIGYLYKKLSINKDQLQIHVYDSLSQNSAGGLGGLAYDGKLIIGQYAGSQVNVPIDIQLQIVNLFISQLKGLSPYSKEMINTHNYEQNK